MISITLRYESIQGIAHSGEDMLAFWLLSSQKTAQ